MIPVGYQPHGTAENDAKLGSLPRSPWRTGAEQLGLKAVKRRPQPDHAAGTLFDRGRPPKAPKRIALPEC
jgi:hypothetical protein